MTQYRKKAELIFLPFTLANRKIKIKAWSGCKWSKWATCVARPTNNAEQFSGQRKRSKFKCEHFTKFCAGLHEIFGLHGMNLSSFVVCCNVVELFLFLQNINKSSVVKIFPQNADDPQPTKHFPRQQDLSGTEQRYIGGNAKLIRQTLVLICSLRAESLHTLLSVAEGLLQF